MQCCRVAPSLLCRRQQSASIVRLQIRHGHLEGEVIAGRRPSPCGPMTRTKQVLTLSRRGALAATSLLTGPISNFVFRRQFEPPETFRPPVACSCAIRSIGFLFPQPHLETGGRMVVIATPHGKGLVIISPRLGHRLRRLSADIALNLHGLQSCEPSTRSNNIGQAVWGPSIGNAIPDCINAGPESSDVSRPISGWGVVSKSEQSSSNKQSRYCAAGSKPRILSGGAK